MIRYRLSFRIYHQLDLSKALPLLMCSQICKLSFDD